MIALICAVILGFISIYLFDKAPLFWVLFVLIAFFIIMWSRATFPVRGPWVAMNFKERLSRNTMPPINIMKAMEERYALNKEAKTENPQPYRMREIAKRLIFIDGYMAGRRQGGTNQ